MPRSHPAWQDLLDCFEQTLDHAAAQSHMIGDERVQIDTSVLFAPPASMPPFPLELAERARHLLERNAEVQQQLNEAASRLPRPSANAATGPRSPQARRSRVAPSFEAFA